MYMGHSDVPLTVSDGLLSAPDGISKIPRLRTARMHHTFIPIRLIYLEEAFSPVRQSIILPEDGFVTSISSRAIASRFTSLSSSALRMQTFLRFGFVVHHLFPFQLSPSRSPFCPLSYPLFTPNALLDGRGFRLGFVTSIALTDSSSCAV